MSPHPFFAMLAVCSVIPVAGFALMMVLGGATTVCVWRRQRLDITVFIEVGVGDPYRGYSEVHALRTAVALRPGVATRHAVAVRVLGVKTREVETSRVA